MSKYFKVKSEGIVNMGCIFFTAILLMLFSTAKAHSQPFAYVTNQFDDTISVINLSTNTVVDTINVGTLPQGLAATPDGQFVYVTNNTSNNISVIQTSNNMIVDTVAVGNAPRNVAITPNGQFVYVTNGLGDSVSVIQTSNNMIVNTVAVGDSPQDLIVSTDGQFVYVTNQSDNNISVIQTSDNTVVDTIAVGDSPTGIGIFIRPEAPVETAPTLSQWGIILFALFSGLLAVRFIRGKQGLGIGS